jgi:hypothetical protein
VPLLIPPSWPPTEAERTGPAEGHKRGGQDATSMERDLCAGEDRRGVRSLELSFRRRRGWRRGGWAGGGMCLEEGLVVVGTLL